MACLCHFMRWGGEDAISCLPRTAHQRCLLQYGCVHLSKQQRFLLARLCLWSTCHSTHEKIKPTYNQTRNKNHTDEARHWTQPLEMSKQYSWWCAGFCLPSNQPPDPHCKASPNLILQVGCMLCVSASIGWCRTPNNILCYSMPVMFTLHFLSFLSFSVYDFLNACASRIHCGDFVILRVVYTSPISPRADFLVCETTPINEHTLPPMRGLVIMCMGILVVITL